MCILTSQIIVKKLLDLDWRFLLCVFPSFVFIAFVSIFIFSSYPIFANTFFLSSSVAYKRSVEEGSHNPLAGDKIAVCLVGGARRFELTGPSIVENVLRVYPKSDLFLNSPLDANSFKFSLLKAAPRIAAVRIFPPQPIQQDEHMVRVLTPMNSPNGIQGLLQYFNLIEGCLTMIQAHQTRVNFTYDWIVRTRVDGYWNAPLDPINFIKGSYVVPPGSSYGGLNDRLGIGDYNSSIAALSRLSMIPEIDAANYRLLNSETSFKAQLTVRGISFRTIQLPFCIVSDRSYDYPPRQFGVPVAAISSEGPLSGVKCRPCQPVCENQCVERLMNSLNKDWSWTEWKNGTLRLCDAHSGWETGWETEFDRVAGEKLAEERKRASNLTLKECVRDFDEMKRRASFWNTPLVADICRMRAKSI